jgi:hypothetical protein
VDDLQERVRRHRRRRSAAVETVEPFVDKGLARLQERLNGAMGAAAARRLRLVHDQVLCRMLPGAVEAAGLSAAQQRRLVRHLEQKMAHLMHPVLEALRRERARFWPGRSVLPLHEAVTQLPAPLSGGETPSWLSKTPQGRRALAGAIQRQIREAVASMLVHRAEIGKSSIARRLWELYTEEAKTMCAEAAALSRTEPARE